MLLGGGAGLGIGAAGAAIGGFGLATAANLDQANFGFERLMGSAEAAAPVMAKLKVAAMNTPFDLNDVIKLAFRLKSAGRSADQLTDDAMTLADALAATGGGAQQLEAALFQIQQLQGRSKILEREDLRTLNNQLPGFMASFQRIFGDKRQFKAPEEAMQAVFTAIKGIPHAAGAAAAATEQTFAGRFSKFKDKIQINFADAFMPKKEELFAGLDVMSEAIGGFLEKFAPVAAAVLTKFAGIVASGLKAVGPLLIVFTEAFPKALETVVGWIDKGVSAFMGLGLSSDQVAKGITSLIGGGLLLKFAGMIMGIVTPILTFGTSINKFIGSFGSLSGIFGKLSGMGTSLMQVLAGLMMNFSAAGGGLSGLGAAASAAAAAMGPVGWIIAGIVAAIAGIAVAIKTTKGAWDSLKETAVSLWNQIKPGIALIGSGLKDAFNGVVNALKPLGIALINFFKLIANTGYYHAVAMAIGLIVKAIGKFIEGLGWVIGLIGKIPGFNKIMGDSFTDSADKAKKAAEEEKKAGEKRAKAAKDAADAQVASIEKVLEKAQTGMSNAMDFLSVGLKPIDTSSVKKAQQSIADNMKTVQKRSDDIMLIAQAGFGDLVVHAMDTGGEAGVQLMTRFADALRKGKPGVLTEYRKTLEDMKALEMSVQMLQEDPAFKKNLAKRAWSVANASGGNFWEATLKDVKNGVPGAVGKANDILKSMQKTSGLGSVPFTEEFKDQYLQLYQAQKEYADNKKYLGSIVDRELVNGNDYDNKRKQQEGRRKIDDARIAQINKLEEDRQSFSSTPSRAGMINMVPTIATGVADAIGFMQEKMPLLQDAASRLGSSVTSGLSTGISTLGSVVGTIGGWLGSIVGNVASTAGRVLSGAVQIGTNIFSGIVRGVSSAVGTISDVASRIWDAIHKFLRDNITNPIRNFKIPGNIPFISGLQPFGSFPALASGTRDWKGGPAIMNERGPENVILPRGSQVIPYHKSRQMNEGGGTVIEKVEVIANGVSYEDAMYRMEQDLRVRLRRVV